MMGTGPVGERLGPRAGLAERGGLGLVGSSSCPSGIAASMSAATLMPRIAGRRRSRDEAATRGGGGGGDRTWPSGTRGRTWRDPEVGGTRAWAAPAATPGVDAHAAGAGHGFIFDDDDAARFADGP